MEIITNKMNRVKAFRFFLSISLILILAGCDPGDARLQVEIYETSADGNKLTKVDELSGWQDKVYLKIYPDSTFQTITGFGTLQSWREYDSSRDTSQIHQTDKAAFLISLLGS